MPRKKKVLFRIIGSYKVYDNEYLFKELSIIANHLVHIINALPKEIDYSNTFPDLLRFSQTETLPSWILPISNSLKNNM